MRLRDFAAYHAATHRRAWADTQRFALEHVYAEVAVSVAVAIASGLQWWRTLGGRELLEAVSVAFIGGILTTVVLLSVFYLWNLALAPARIHVEQENELTRHVPVQAPKSYRGLLDFLYDVQKNISAGAVSKTTIALGRLAEHMGAKLEKATAKANRSASVVTKRRAAIRIGRDLQAMARRLRRLQAKYKAAAARFEETFVGAVPQVVANTPPEELASTIEAVRGARESTYKLKQSMSSARLTVVEHLAGLQEQMAIGSEQLGSVMLDVERTAGAIVSVLDKIVKGLGKRPPVAQKAKGRR